MLRKYDYTLSCFDTIPEHDGHAKIVNTLIIQKIFDKLIQ